MKVWQVLLVGGGVLVAAMVLMKMSQPKAKPVNSSFGMPSSAINGLAAGIGGLFSAFASRQSSTSSVVVPNEGTYNTSFIPNLTGNTLTDPNTGNTLIYGTD